jgi:hypothetical protein
LNELARIVEALLFLSSEPVSATDLAEAAEVGEGEIVEALARLREHYAEGYRGVVLREVAGGFTLATDPVAERAARRLLAKPRTPRSRRPRPSAWPSSPTCSRSRGRRSLAFAASRPSRRWPRCSSAA